MSISGFSKRDEQVNAEELARDHWLRQHATTWFTKILRQSQELGFRSLSGLLSKVLRDPHLHSSQRRLLSDTLYDLLRKMRRLKALSAMKSPTAEQYYGLWLADRFLKEQQQTNPVFVNRLLESIGFSAKEVLARFEHLEQVDQLDEHHPDLVARIADAESYPTWQVELIVSEYGSKRAIQILRGQNRRAPLSIRVNRLSISRSDFASRLTNAGIANSSMEFAPDGLILQTRTNMYGLPEFQEGMFELQDEGSQLIAELVAPPPAAVVIDACAGAGGKTLALGAMMQNKGRMYALDVDDHKLVELRKRTRRAGLSNVQAIHLQKEPISHLTSVAKRVLCDVPCSGIGVLRRHPEARWAIQRNEIQELAQKQLSILQRAAPWVKEGGRLIYSTCTLLQKENQEVVQSFLQTHSQFVLMPVKEIWGTNKAIQLGDGTFFQTLPTSEEGPDGFFAAVLRKLGADGG